MKQKLVSWFIRTKDWVSHDDVVRYPSTLANLSGEWRLSVNVESIQLIDIFGRIYSVSVSHAVRVKRFRDVSCTSTAVSTFSAALMQSSSQSSMFSLFLPS